jgi:hypothetical protein
MSHQENVSIPLKAQPGRWSKAAKQPQMPAKRSLLTRVQGALARPSIGMLRVFSRPPRLRAFWESLMRAATPPGQAGNTLFLSHLLVVTFVG